MESIAKGFKDKQKPLNSTTQKPERHSENKTTTKKSPDSTVSEHKSVPDTTKCEVSARADSEVFAKHQTSDYLPDSQCHNADYLTDSLLAKKSLLSYSSDSLDMNSHGASSVSTDDKSGRHRGAHYSDSEPRVCSKIVLWMFAWFAASLVSLLVVFVAWTLVQYNSTLSGLEARIDQLERRDYVAGMEEIIQQRVDYLLAQVSTIVYLTKGP